jgi:hypothetical protein
MSLHHTDDPVCPLCEAKLQQAHSYLQGFFREKKKKYSNLHVSWSFRNKVEQEQAYLDGKTRAHFPKSPHNKMKDGKPCAEALDLFQIDEDGVARFSPLFYVKLSHECEEDKLPIVWGGNFKKLHDYDHFELDKKALGEDA